MRRRDNEIICLLAVQAALWCLTANVRAQSQSVQVTTRGQSVRVEHEGDCLRVRTPGQSVQVSGDWRQRRTAYAGDTAQIIAELGVQEEGGALRVALGGDILFDFDATAIRPDATETLGQVAHVIRERSRGDIYVVGHTDALGSDSYSQPARR